MRPGATGGHHAVVGGERTRPRAADASLALALALALGVVSVAAGAASDLTWADLLDGFVVSSTVNGLALALAGYPIARLRPGNAVGWLLLGAGLAYALSGAGYAVLAWAADAGETGVGWRLLADVTSIGWPLAVSFFVPLTLLVFPDGALPSRRWRAVVILACVATIGVVATMTLGPLDTTSDLGVSGFLRWPTIDHLDGLAAASFVLVYVVFAAGVVSLAVRYRRGDDQRRRQILWVLLAALVLLTVSLVNDLLGLETWFAIFVFTLPAVAIAIAILRYRLLDIQVVVSRFVLYLVMTGLVVATYTAIVAITERTLSARLPLGPPVLAAVAIALGFNPLRHALQKQIDRLFYGARSDPAHAVAAVGSRLGEVGVRDATGLNGLLGTVCQVLRLPWARITVDGATVAEHGIGSSAAGRDGAGLSDGPSVPLRLGGEDVGELIVGLRRGQRRLDGADHRVLHLLSASLAVAVEATRYADDLRHARSALVEGREAERRRLSRDLHDGVGPALTGVILKADAARRLAPTDPVQAAALMDDVRRRTADALDEVRRLGRALRPPALDAVGLVAAVEDHAATLRPLEVSVISERPLPVLPPAVEVAAYRVATEALTNVVRHSSAAAAVVEIRATGTALTVAVRDDARGGEQPWNSGVGLASMRERAAELGGTFAAGPGPDGGRVEVTIPCGGAG